MQLKMTMTKETGTAPMEEVVMHPPMEETMIGGAPQVPIRGIGVAPTMDMDPYQILDQSEEGVLNMEEQRARSMTDTKGHYFSFLAICYCLHSS